MCIRDSAFNSFEEALRHFVAAGYASEYVDEDCFHSFIHEDEFQGVLDYFRPCTSTNIKEIRSFSAFSLDRDVYKRQVQKGAYRRCSSEGTNRRH